MGHYDGHKFIAPNALGFAPGQPLDAWGEAIFRADEMWLLKHGNWHHHGLWREKTAYNEAGGDRAYASAQATCWFAAPYYALPTMTSVDIVICGRVQTIGSSSAQVTVTAELAGIGKVKVTFGQTSNYEDMRITIPITAPVGAPFMTQLRLWVQSGITGGTGKVGAYHPTTFAGGITRTLEVGVTPPDIYPAQSWPSPSATTLGEQATALPSGGFWDHILRGPDGVFMVSTALPDQLPPDGAPNFKTVYLSYLQVRGFTVRENFTPELYAASEIRALIPVLGQTTSQHPAALLAALRRPQLLSLGHPGELDYSRVNVDLPEGYTTPYQWVTCYGSWTGPSTVWSQPVLLDEADVELEIRILYLPTHVLPDYSVGKLDDLLKDAALTTWELELSATTYADGSAAPSLVGTKTTTLAGAAHLPTDQSGVWPILRQRRWACGEFESGFVGYSMPSAYEPGEIRPTYKEGQLFGPDFALLSEAVIKLPLTGAPTDKAVCLALTATRTGTITINAPTAASNPDDADRMQLVIVGMSVWAHHKGSSTPASVAAPSGKTIADKADIPALLRYAVGQPVRSADWIALAAQANRLWARRGSRGIGRVYKEGSIYGAAWVSNSTTSTGASAVTGVNERLSNISGPGWMLHEVEPDRGAVRLYLEAHGRNCQLTCQVYALDTGTLIGTITTTASDWELMSGVLDLPLSASHEGGSTANAKRLVLIKLLLKVPISGIAQLSYWQLREEPITDTADLPA